MEVTLFFGQENTGGFTDVIGTTGAPWDVDWVSFTEDSNELSVDDEATISDFDCSWESSMDRVVLKKIFEISQIFVWSVNGNDSSLILLAHEGRSEDESTDSSETIDTHGGNHFFVHVVISDRDVSFSRNSWSSHHLDRGSWSRLFNGGSTSAHVGGSLHGHVDSAGSCGLVHLDEAGCVSLNWSSTGKLHVLGPR